MIARGEIQTLAQWKPDGYPIVSLYLDVGRAVFREQEFDERADALICHARSELARQCLDGHAMERARYDLDEVARFLHNDFKRDQSRGLALFASSKRGLWRAFRLMETVKDRLVVAPRPYIRPIVSHLEQDPHCAAVMLDRETAHFYVFDQGEIAGEEIWTDDVLHKVWPGGWYGLSDRRGGQHFTEPVHQHLIHVAAMLDMHVRWKGVRHVIVGGTPGVVAEFRRTLSRRVRECLVPGSIPEALHGPPTKEYVLKHATELLQKAENEANDALMQAVLDEAGRHRYGVVGLETTLRALYHGAVQTLVVERDLTAPGFICRHCGRLFVAAVACPACSATDAVPSHDIIEDAVDMALADGGEVVFVHSTREWALRGTCVGGLLRFLIDVPDETVLAETARKETVFH